MERDIVWFALGLLAFASTRGIGESVKQATSLARSAANIGSAVCLGLFMLGVMVGRWGVSDMSPLLGLAGLAQIGAGLYVSGVGQGMRG